MDLCAFEALLDSLTSWTALLDPGGAISVVNRAWSDYLGANPFVSGLGPGDDYAAVVRRLAGDPDGNLALVALGLTAVLQGRVPRLSLEFPLKGKETLWFGVVAARWGDRVTMHHVDITERMRVMHRLRKAESLFKATTEYAQDLISVLDDQGHVVFASHSHLRILGYPEPEWRQLRPEGLVHPTDLDGWRDRVREAFKAGFSPAFEYRLRDHAGAWRTFEGHATVIEAPSSSQDSVLLISRDITQRKRAELERDTMEVQLRQAQKMEAVGQLAAGIAHEINSPTQYISDNVRFLEEAFTSLAQILREEGALAGGGEGADLAGRAARVQELIRSEDLAYLLEEVPRAIQQSQEGLARVTSIVNAMKIFSHPGVGGRTPVDFNQAVENTCIVARNAWKYVADLELDLAPELPPMPCHAGEINQMILNLLINAVHAVEAVVAGTGGKGSIRVSTGAEAGHLVLRIADSGGGIPERIRDQVFLPFFTTKPVGKGTGQGLAIVHSVVVHHGGSVEFTSEEGKGTVFTVRLPMAGAPEA